MPQPMRVTRNVNSGCAFFKLAVEMHAAYTHVRAKGGAGWNQGELAQRQLGLLTLTAFLLTSAQNMSR